ncbi:DISARM system SNF2-like helicase DrmD [Nannocystis pusilla]|uniref:DISARM system SNF2-like helicase DrmD n=2 Tax=Nannocystis pusilla TaxID=889268 RepID=A0ABS7TJ10_9BACT|nr:DISARM system SNF2-like helicase DrmD [Nannocystis pusilla]
MAVVRGRRAMITGVRPFDAEDGRHHLVEVEYSDGIGAETDQLLWEVEPGTDVLEPSALPRVGDTSPMDVREFDAMVRATRWSALTPSLPFSGLDEDRPPLASPLFGAIHPEAYQLVPVLRALEMPRVALMLADAVGLGKTIQAGMILRELMLRRRIRRVLILCPASLRTQWRDEMVDKFALSFEVVDRGETLKLRKELGVDANPWRTHERLITSYHYLKQPDVLEQFRSAAEPGDDGRLRWDLLIVDEAHNLAPAASVSADSDVARMLRLIAPWFEHRVFLTATPHNGHTFSFSGLLEALDPVRFTRKSELGDEDRRRVAHTVIRRLKSEINACYTAANEPPRFSERLVEALPQLRFGAQERDLHLAVRDFQRALKRSLGGASAQDRTAAMFATEVLQKRLLSGPWPFGQSWLALIEGLDQPDHDATAAAVVRLRSVQADDTEDDGERESRQRLAERTVGAWLRPWREKVAAELAHVTELVQAIGVTRVQPGLDPDAHAIAVANQAAQVKVDARMRALEALIDEKLRNDQRWRDDERLVVFTEYLATLDYLRARLHLRYGDGDWLLALYGGMNDVQRDHIKRHFNDPRGPARVLLATDAAGEGLNLQRAARYLLHWDIPWNPGRMEQRNGRLDRHGQERDVHVFHFDSNDDASMRFMAKVLRKRSQTREDRVVTDEIFADAILAHFEHDEDIVQSEQRLERVVSGAQQANAEIVEDLPAGPALPGKDDEARLNSLRSELDLSPESIRETLETAMAIDLGRPRLKPDGQGRDRFVSPVPRLWRELVEQTLREDSSDGAMPALVFDPAHYVQRRSGRPVYVPEPDSRLLHLGDAIYHRVMSTFASFRFPGGPSAATRWIARQGPVPAGADALVLLTVEELAVNELREPCHHWVRTIALPIRGDSLGEPLPERAAARWAASPTPGDRDAARVLWDGVADEVKKHVQRLQRELTAALKARLAAASKVVREQEKKRFERRERELKKAMSDSDQKKLLKERKAEEAKRHQLELYAEHEQAAQRKLVDIDVELALRATHYKVVLELLKAEEERTLKHILPGRYALRGDAHVYPVAVEIRTPGVAA